MQLLYAGDEIEKLTCKVKIQQQTHSVRFQLSNFKTKLKSPLYTTVYVKTLISTEKG